MGIVARTLEDGTTHQHDPFDISTIVRRTSELAWVDLVDTGDDDFGCLATEIGLVQPEPGRRLAACFGCCGGRRWRWGPWD